MYFGCGDDLSFVVFYWLMLFRMINCYYGMFGYVYFVIVELLMNIVVVEGVWL